MIYTYNALIKRVIDGDTFEAEVDLGFKIWAKDRFRLFGYSAPETHGDEKPYGIIAKTKLESLLVVGRIYVIKTTKPDKYGRWLAEILYPIDETLNAHLIKQGYGLFWNGQSTRPVFDFRIYPTS